jgi:hypothetical protein
MARLANQYSRSHAKPKKYPPTSEDASLLLLSEKFIAQLQKAVSAAQRKRISDRDDASARSPE